LWVTNCFNLSLILFLLAEINLAVASLDIKWWMFTNGLRGNWLVTRLSVLMMHRHLWVFWHKLSLGKLETKTKWRPK
jgi:hypothetical protein